MPPTDPDTVQPTDEAFDEPPEEPTDYQGDVDALTEPKD